MKNMKELIEKDGLETKLWEKNDKKFLYCSFYGKTRGYIDLNEKKVVVYTKTYSDELDIIAKEVL